MTAATDHVRAKILDLLSETIFQFPAPHQRTGEATHTCATVGMHSLHVCDCGWLWTSNEMAHTAPPPPLPTLPPEPPGPAAWPRPRFEFDTSAGEPRVHWTDEADDPPRIVAVETPSAAPVSPAPADPKTRLVAILAHLHDLSAEVQALAEGGPGIVSVIPQADNGAMDVGEQIRAAIMLERGVDAREVLAKMRRGRISTNGQGLPGEAPWCRICGNYCAYDGAIAGDPKRCTDQAACTGRLVDDAHVIARLSTVDTAS